jgi:predicted  nucleic acid-binding Zn-ribbon protein
MRTLVESLVAAQSVLLQQPKDLPARQELLERLRASVPAPVLAHYLRMVEQGRKGAVVVRHGVCTGCHLRVASGIVNALASQTDLHLCDNCGAYLMLAPEEMPSARAEAAAVAEPVKVRKPRARRVVTAA